MVINRPSPNFPEITAALASRDLEQKQAIQDEIIALRVSLSRLEQFIQ
jgi:hypothetical protein